MSVKSGQRYKFTNEENGLVFDQSRYRHKIANEEHGLVDEKSGGKKSIIGHDCYGGDNQQVSRLSLIRWLVPSATTIRSSGSQRSRTTANGLSDQSGTRSTLDLRMP